MHKLRSNGLGIVGLVFMALAATQCGDSSVKVIGGGDPTPGTFRGTTNRGGIVTLQVGSVESAFLECEGQTFGGSCNPVLEVVNGNASGTCNGLFVDVTFTSSTQGTINDISADTSCDGEGSVFLDDGSTPGTPTPTITPTNGGVTVTPTPVGSGGTPTVTPTVDLPPDPNATPTVLPCPDAARVEGTAGDTKVLDSGWTGLGHNAGVISDGILTVSMNCSTTERPCGTCPVSGPIANPDAGNGVIDNQRCSGDPSTRCTSSGDCSGACNFFFGGPLPLVAGSVATCVVNEVTGSLSGSANVENGSFESDIGLTSSVFTGGTIDAPCPTCDGDSVRNDGNLDGTCNGGARNGQACDVTGSSVQFGETSLDCPPAGTPTGALPIDLAGSSGQESLVTMSNSPNCRANGTTDLLCPCDICRSGTTCMTHDDCPGEVEGCGGLRCLSGPNSGDACTTPGVMDPACNPGENTFNPCSAPGQPTSPNACIDLNCVPISGSSREGECATGGPFEQLCGPTDTFRGCLSDNDCPTAGDSCQVATARPCFLTNGLQNDTIVAQGTAGTPSNGISNGTFAATFCIPHVASGAVNLAAGLPGPGRIELPIEGREVINGNVAPF